MNLFKRKDGRSPFWFVDMTDGRGRRVRKSTGQTDRRAAMRVAMAMAQDTRQDTRDITLRDALAAYVDDMRALRRRSWEDAQIKADKLVGNGGSARWGGRFHLDGDMKVSALGPGDLARLMAARAAEGNSLGTVSAELRILRAACRFAAEQGYAPARVTRWRVPPPDRRLRYLSADEAQRVLRRLHPDTPYKVKSSWVVPQGRVREARQDVHDLFLALVLTGGRWAEVGRLTWRQVDFAAETITLYGWKTERERTVPMVPEVRAMLERRAKMPRGSLVFPGVGGKPRAAPTRAIVRAMDAEGLNDPEVVSAFGRATTHSLRHTYASWLRQRGLGLDEIQPLLGHADIAVTRIYAKVVDADTFKRARAALGQEGTLLAHPPPPSAGMATRVARKSRST